MGAPQDLQLVDSFLTQFVHGYAARVQALPLRPAGSTLAPILFVIGIGLTGLAVWVARRITRPLGRFAEATVRLGADVAAAAPLDEKGPSEIREVARALNTMQAQIRRLLEGRTHMLAAVSHDLRTPLTRLRLRTEFVEDDQERAKMLKDLDEMEAMIHAAIAYVRSDGGSESLVQGAPEDGCSAGAAGLPSSMRPSWASSYM